MSNGLRLTEILHIIRNGKTHLFRQSEVMVNHIPTCKNNSSEVRKIYLLLSNVFSTYSLNMNKLTKRSEEHTSELQSRGHLVCRLLLEKKKPVRHLYPHHT